MIAWNIYKYEIRNESLRPFAGSRGILSLFEPARGPPAHLTHSKMTNLKQDSEMSFLKNKLSPFWENLPNLAQYCIFDFVSKVLLQSLIVFEKYAGDHISLISWK